MLRLGKFDSLRVGELESLTVGGLGRQSHLHLLSQTVILSYCQTVKLSYCQTVILSYCQHAKGCSPFLQYLPKPLRVSVLPSLRVERKQRVQRFKRSRCGHRRNAEKIEVRRHGEVMWGTVMIVGTILPCPP